VCHTTCLEGKCIGPKSYQCTGCEANKVIEFVLDRRGKKAHYGQCQLCASSCTSGKCVGKRGDQCTECSEGRVLMKSIGRNYGQCIRCASSCADRKCVGPRSDQCTSCNAPRILKVNKNPDFGLNGTTSGQCAVCSSNCKEMKCVGAGSDECTECYGDRSLVLKVGFNNTREKFGQCHTCASNCKVGSCAGPHSYQCLACEADRLLVKPKDGPLAGKAYGSCMRCYSNCKPNSCVGEESYQCTECPARLPFLIPAKDGVTYGYCTKSAVAENTAVSAALKDQANYIEELKKQMRFEQQKKELGETKMSGTDLSEMQKASQNIASELNDVDRLASSAMFAATARVKVGHQSQDVDVEMMSPVEAKEELRDVTTWV
jgi:hypothetical protein